ncbi:MAG: DMT family transporter [Actinomycetota bacterium]
MNREMAQGPDRTVMAAFFASVFIGGTNFVAVKFSNAELPPLFGAAVRFAAAALIFLAIMRVMGMKLPRGHALAGAAIYGVLNFGVFYALLYYALTGVSAGTTSVVLSSAPLMTLVLAVAHRQERFTLRGIIGGLLAVAGIAVMSYRNLGGDLPLLPLLATIGGALVVAESTVIVKAFPKSHPITTNAFGMVVGAAGLFAASAIFGESWIVPQQGRTWLVLGYLTIVGSVGLFGLFLYVIKRWTASSSVYAVTLMPFVAVTLGALLAHERITSEVLAGGALVILGVYVGALSERLAAHRAQRQPPEPVPIPEPAALAPPC